MRGDRPGAKRLVRRAVAISEHALAAQNTEKESYQGPGQSRKNVFDALDRPPSSWHHRTRDAPECHSEKRQKRCKSALSTYHHAAQFSWPRFAQRWLRAIGASTKGLAPCPQRSLVGEASLATFPCPNQSK